MSYEQIVHEITEIVNRLQATSNSQDIITALEEVAALAKLTSKGGTLNG